MKRLMNILKKISFTLLILAIISSSSFIGFGTKTASAASSGPLSPGTTASPSTALGYGVGLTSPDNMKVSDNVYASYDILTNPLTYQATNFGFSIPTGSTIDGILFEIERKSLYGGENIVDNPVKVIKANGTVGSASKHTGTAWALSDQYDSFGGATDLWSETWTAEDINDIDFGIAFSSFGYEVFPRIDHIRCTVYYTAGGGGGSSSPTLIIDKIQSTQTRKINSIDYSTIKRINLITSN